MAMLLYKYRKGVIICPYKLSVDLPAVNAGYDYAVLAGKIQYFFHTGTKASVLPRNLSGLS